MIVSLFSFALFAAAMAVVFAVLMFTLLPAMPRITALLVSAIDPKIDSAEGWVEARPRRPRGNEHRFTATALRPVTTLRAAA